MIWLLLGATTLLNLIQAALVWKFVRHLSHSRGQPESEIETFPPVAVVLAARGADPYLRQCLEALGRQNWPNYRVWVVVDNERDPAVAIVESERRDNDHWPGSLLVANEHPPTRSLKCNSLLAALERIDSHYEIVALLDADVVPDRDWIRRLTAPLRDASIGAAYGMRWFDPPNPGLGGLIRAIWNAAAIVQMQAYRIPWGGSLAIRRSSLVPSKVLDRWKTALFEDVLVADQLDAHQLKTHPCSDLVLVNRESTSLRATLHWIARQLLDVKMYHRCWPWVMLHGLSVGGIWILLLGLALGFTLAGKSSTATGILGIFVLNSALNLTLLAWVRRGINGVRRDASLRSISWTQRGSYLAAVVVAPIAHLFALLRAMTMRSVRWRGIEYEIAAKNEVIMRSYRPMSGGVQASPDQYSIE